MSVEHIYAIHLELNRNIVLFNGEKSPLFTKPS
jgi:hypothetical protein